MSLVGMKVLEGDPRWSRKHGLSGAAGPQPQEKEVIPQPPNFIDIYLINKIIFKVYNMVI